MAPRQAKATPSAIEREQAALIEKLQQQLDKREQRIDELTQQIGSLNQNVARLTEQLAEFQRMLFGRRSEKMPPMHDHVRRIVEKHELTIDGEAMPTEPKARKREIARHGRKKSEATRQTTRKIKKNLPIVHERVEVHPNELPEGTSIGDFREIQGGEPIRRIEHVREHLVIVEYALQTLVSRDGQTIVKAAVPAGVSEGCGYGPGLHAHVAVAKCADAIPFHRLSRILARGGLSVARSTLCSLFHRSAQSLLPIYNQLVDEARRDPYLHADETTLGVLAKKKCHIGWVWGLMSERVIAYSFAYSRSGKVAQQLIGQTTGYLTVDGYSGYNQVDEKKGNRIRVGCWGHFSRKFYGAMKSEPKAREVLELVVGLYLIERRATVDGIHATVAHLARRQHESAPLVEAIERWVDQEKAKHSPRSLMGKALTYAVNQRTRLRRFLEDANLSLDNNYAERCLRIVALGRKNFLFAGNEACAQNLAVLQSIVSTCQLYRINPYEYIKDILIRIQTYKQNCLPDLLPWNWKPTLCTPTNMATAPP